jgi:hypothetical protein
MHPGQSAHQRYLDIFEIVQQRGREMARIFDDPKRSCALMMLAQIHLKACTASGAIGRMRQREQRLCLQQTFPRYRVIIRN